MRIDDEKRELRLKIKEWRRNVPDKDDKDKRIFDRLLSIDAVKSAKIILTYVSTDIEVDTRRLIDYCFENGITVAAPRCVSKTEMKFHIITSWDNLEETHFSLLEPFGNLPVADNYDGAVCIVPALAYDRECYRLGYGGGYYDRFVSFSGVKTIGICYSDNIENKLPVSEYDIKTELVVTENGVFGGNYER